MLELVILITLIIVVIIGYNMFGNKKMEGYYGNVGSGQFCITCSGKTYNQALSCWNCGWCTDRKGNGKAIGGDAYGPFNMEDCTTWTHGDPFSYMMQRNSNYPCSYGPRAVNRLIGI